MKSELARKSLGSALVVAVGVSGMLAFGTGCRSKPSQPALLGAREVVPPPYVEPGSSRTSEIALPAEPALPLSATPALAPAESVIKLPPPVASQPITYTVQKNDTLWDIARMYGVSHQELAAENKIKSGDEKKLAVGTTLRIPPGGHFVPPEKRPKVAKSEKDSGKRAKSEHAAKSEHGTKPAKSSSEKAGKSDAKSSKAPLPADGKYTVKSGDSLWKIAHEFGLSSDDIRKQNSLTSDVLQVGQVLVLPTAKTEGAAPMAAPEVVPTPPGLGTPAAEAVPGTTGAAPEAGTPAPTEGATATPAGGAAATTPAPAPNLDMPKTLDHTVEQGETLETIADMYGTTVDEIKKANPTVKGNADLKLKMKLVVPYK
ncbi:MAG: hypothetical protein A3K19_27545 [Lentisphaerae bacterium RIFOXYB12_FULL_65_16]|nr:MAG: hypothetical protein A3K18_06390 [Lentisphaerae bacterium RIFOXYA12_64_32]OGV86465.1 MAG: hypothetical protein A3K19_27545 [Lentisphaerae bacterium RIFOXYB12_FULL_65_16]